MCRTVSSWGLEALCEVDGVFVPGGFGVRETQGKMLAMQTTQMKWKKQLVQLKIKTEMLKQEVLKKQLEVTEELEESSDSDNEVEDV